MRTFIFCLATAVAVSGLAVNSTQAANGNENRAQQIAGDLKQSGKLKDYRVGVKFEDGVAWLTGTVTDQRQKQIAEEVTLRSPGVTHVVNKLEVENFGNNFETVEPDFYEDQNYEDQNYENQNYEDQNLRIASNQRANFQQRPMAAPRRQSAAPRRQSAAPRRQSAAPRRKAAAPRRQAMAPRNNMPVPYASAGRQNVRPASYGRQAQAQYCPDGSCMTGGGMQGGGMQGGGMQGGMQPSPMRGGAPPAVGQAASYDNPQLPGYAWPSYAASSNYAALTYPKQYSPSAWPYIGPFYPYPQVPLGWRKVTLEWDDGWWFLDFKDK